MIEAVKRSRSIIITYFINLSLLSVTWGGLYRRSFNSDTIFHMVAQEGDIYTRVEDGRYLWALLDYLLYRFGISTTDHTGVTVLISLALLAVGVCFVQKTFRDYLPLNEIWEKAIFLAVSNLLFVNVLFAEVLMFCECALAFGMTYMLAALGAYLFKQKKYIWFFAAIFCATLFYQVGAILGAILIGGVIYFEYFYQKEKINIGKTLFGIMIGGLCTFGSAFINMLSSQLLVWIGVIPELRKIPQISGIGEKIKIVILSFGELLKDSKNLLPSLWIPLLIILLCFLVLLRYTANAREWKQLISIFLIYAAMNAMVFIIPFMTKEVNCPPRIVFPFYAALAMLFIMVLSCVGGNGRRWLAGAGIGFFLIQIIFSQIIVSDHLHSNKLDILYANMAYHKIMDYEAESGIAVEYLAVERDIDCAPYYEEVKYHTDQINERALGQVTNTLMNVMTPKEFKILEMDKDIYNQYFKDKDWRYFDLEEQMIIINDTAYWVIF